MYNGIASVLFIFLTIGSGVLKLSATFNGIASVVFNGIASVVFIFLTIDSGVLKLSATFSIDRNPNILSFRLSLL